MMKKISLGLAAFALIAGSASVSAQSSVTVFGVIDLAARSVTNDTTQRRLEASGLSSSRLGFRGIEDLGDGLKAGFWLEGALTADDGNATGMLWQRRATVSLLNPYVELRLGRDKVPTQLDWDAFDPFDNVGIAADTRLSVASGIVPAGGAYNTFTRASNTVAVLTTASTGLFAHLMVAAGEGAYGNKLVTGRLGYKTPELLVSGSYGSTEVSASLKAKTYNLGVSYDLKAAKLFGMYSSLEIGSASQNNKLIGVTVPINQFLLRASYQTMTGKGDIAGRDAKMLALGGVYNLSRRTAIYATYADIKNTNTNFTVATGSALTRGHKSSGYDLGLRHSF
jgi:predicted porin